MKVVTCCGFYGSGSSAITDLLREYDNVACGTDYEISLIYMYHGLNDLYHYLIECPERNNVNYAIGDFYRTCLALAKGGMNYEKYFNHVFMDATKEYLVKLSPKFYFARDYHFEKSNSLRAGVHHLLNKVYQVITRGKNPYHLIYVSEPQPFYLPELSDHEFIQFTKEYLEILLQAIKGNKELVMVDQLVSASGFERCTRYFDDLKIILVDRDPRDIFLSMKYIWKERDEFWDNVQLFCDWYRWAHQMSFPRPTNVLRIQFEDLIFHYSMEVDKIEQFIGGGVNQAHHTMSKTSFKPEESKQNCRLWERYPNESMNIKLIQENLKNYLVD